MPVVPTLHIGLGETGTQALIALGEAIRANYGEVQLYRVQYISVVFEAFPNLPSYITQIVINTPPHPWFSQGREPQVIPLIDDWLQESRKKRFNLQYVKDAKERQAQRLLFLWQLRHDPAKITSPIVTAIKQLQEQEVSTSVDAYCYGQLCEMPISSWYFDIANLLQHYATRQDLSLSISLCLALPPPVTSSQIFSISHEVEVIAFLRELARFSTKIEKHDEAPALYPDYTPEAKYNSHKVLVRNIYLTTPTLEKVTLIQQWVNHMLPRIDSQSGALLREVRENEVAVSDISQRQMPLELRLIRSRSTYLSLTALSDYWIHRLLLEVIQLQETDNIEALILKKYDDLIVHHVSYRYNDRISSRIPRFLWEGLKVDDWNRVPTDQLVDWFTELEQNDQIKRWYLKPSDVNQYDPSDSPKLLIQATEAMLQRLFGALETIEQSHGEFYQSLLVDAQQIVEKFTHTLRAFIQNNLNEYAPRVSQQVLKKLQENLQAMLKNLQMELKIQPNVAINIDRIQFLSDNMLQITETAMFFRKRPTNYASEYITRINEITRLLKRRQLLDVAIDVVSKCIQTVITLQDHVSQAEHLLDFGRRFSNQLSIVKPLQSIGDDVNLIQELWYEEFYRIHLQPSLPKLKNTFQWNWHVSYYGEDPNLRLIYDTKTVITQDNWYTIMRDVIYDLVIEKTSQLTVWNLLINEQGYKITPQVIAEYLAKLPFHQLVNQSTSSKTTYLMLPLKRDAGSYYEQYRDDLVNSLERTQLDDVRVFESSGRTHITLIEEKSNAPIDGLKVYQQAQASYQKQRLSKLKKAHILTGEVQAVIYEDLLKSFYPKDHRFHPSIRTLLSYKERFELFVRLCAMNYIYLNVDSNHYEIGSDNITKKLSLDYLSNLYHFAIRFCINDTDQITLLNEIDELQQQRAQTYVARFEMSRDRIVPSNDGVFASEAGWQHVRDILARNTHTPSSQIINAAHAQIMYDYYSRLQRTLNERSHHDLEIDFLLAMMSVAYRMMQNYVQSLRTFIRSGG